MSIKTKYNNLSGVLSFASFAFCQKKCLLKGNLISVFISLYKLINKLCIDRWMDG